MEDAVHDNFDDAHRALYPDIHRTARNQRVPGLSVQEVENEMVYALWKAWRTYEPTTGDGCITLARYWWRVWMNHKANLIEAAMAKKRQMSFPVVFATSDMDVTVPGEMPEPIDNEFVSLIPGCPVDEPLHQQVWNMLARGYLFTEIQEHLAIKRRVFDAVMGDLRTAMVAA